MLMGDWELSCEVKAASLNFGDKSRTKATVYGTVMMVLCLCVWWVGVG